MISRQSAVAAASVATMLASSPAEAGETALVELFTSQSCSSCIASAEVFDELANRDDLVVLSWHVDYWDALRTRDGAWKDPFSNPAYTERQRAYNKRLRRAPSVYTPQAVIDGASETVGSRRAEIETLVEHAKDDRKSSPSIAFHRDDSALFYEVDDAPDHASILFVRFVDRAATPVTRGENAGATFADVNVVTASYSIASSGSVDAPKSGEGCAIVVAEEAVGRALAARYCP